MDYVHGSPHGWGMVAPELLQVGFRVATIPNPGRQAKPTSVGKKDFILSEEASSMHLFNDTQENLPNTPAITGQHDALYF